MSEIQDEDGFVELERKFYNLSKEAGGSDELGIHRAWEGASHGRISFKSFAS